MQMYQNEEAETNSSDCNLQVIKKNCYTVFLETNVMCSYGHLNLLGFKNQTILNFVRKISPFLETSA